MVSKAAKTSPISDILVAKAAAGQDAAALLAVARTMIDAGEHGSASELLTDLLRASPDDPVIELTLIEALSHQRRSDRYALGSSLEALIGRPDFPPDLLLKASAIFLRQFWIQRAVDAAARAAESGAGSAALIQLARLHVTNDSMSRSKSLLRERSIDIPRRKTKKVLDDIAASSDLNPANLRNMADMAAGLGFQPLAVAFAEQLDNRYPTPENRVFHCHHLLKAGMPDISIQLLLEHLDHLERCGGANAVIASAKILEAAGRFDLLQPFLASAHARLPENAQIAQITTSIQRTAPAIEWLHGAPVATRTLSWPRRLLKSFLP